MVQTAIIAIFLWAVFFDIIPKVKEAEKKEIVLSISITGIAFICIILYSINPELFNPVTEIYKGLKNL